MIRVRLQPTSTLTLRVDLRGILPAALAGRSLGDITRLPVVQGNRILALAELFRVAWDDPPADARSAGSSADAAPELHLEGDFSRCDRIGSGMTGGCIVVHGDAGHHLGTAMTGGLLRVEGSAGDLAACEMAGGTVDVAGSVGDFAASTLPGSMDGMRGGLLAVRGNAGARFADRMRRGTALVFGDAGDFLASRLVAGTVAVGGRCGAHAAYGMRRGSLVFAGNASPLRAGPPLGFVPAGAPADVAWQLLARDLQRHGGPFTALAARRIERHLGDITAAGKGEIIAAPP